MAKAKKSVARKSVRKSAVRKSAVKKGGAKKVRKAAPKKATSARRAAPVKKAAPKRKVKRKPNAAFMRPLSPSPALAAVVGSTPQPRTQVTKKLWEYIKKHKLQDNANRRMINTDEKLKPVLGGKRQVSMFEMTKLVSHHLR